MSAPQSLITYGNAATWTVFTGTWTNWQRGTYLGLTLTTGSTNGLLIVSFLAIFVGMLGGHVWGIICFVTHQTRTTLLSKDGLHHQTQVILRNSTSAADTLWLLIKMAWAWRSRAARPGWRVIPLVITALFQLIFFALAGIFSSYIFTTESEVLIRSNSCGFISIPTINVTNNFNQTQLGAIDALFVERTAASNWAWDYAFTCYGKSPAASCNSLSTPQLNVSFQTVACPFDSQMCLDPVSGSLQADTGYINTNALGINSNYEYSVDYRRVTTCAPLQTQGYYNVVNNSGVVNYNYLYGNTTFLGNVTDSTYLFSYNPAWGGPLTDPTFPTAFGVSYLDDSAGTTFAPIPELNRTDADVTLLMVLNNAIYYAPSTDLWFSAPVADSNSAANRFTPLNYIAPSPQAIVMGCTEQHQMCNPNLPRETGCTPLSGWDVYGSVTNFTGDQLLIARFLYQALDSSLLNNMFFTRGPQALLATLSASGYDSILSGPFPPGHWQQEIQVWVAYTLAYIQRRIVNVATGPSNPAFDQYIVSPGDYVSAVPNATFDMCANTKIRNSSYYSFSLFGLTLTLSIGTILILTNTFLDDIVGWIQSFTGKGVHRKEDWELDSLLQVQRMAFEGARLGQWTNMHGNIPITIKATGLQTFGKPGRGRGNYEPLSTREALYSPGEEPAMAPDGIWQGTTDYMGPMMDGGVYLQGYNSGRTSAHSSRHASAVHGYEYV